MSDSGSYALQQLLMTADVGQSTSAVAWLSGDIDGDGYTELVQPFDAGGRLGMAVYGWSQNQLQLRFRRADMGQGSGALNWLIGDVNGDGRAEVIQLWNHDGALGMIVYGWTGVALGTLWSSEKLGQGAGAVSWLIGDVNGDGRDELMQQWDYNGRLGVTVYGWTEAGMKVLWKSSDMGVGVTALSWLIGDVNGDGNAEVVQLGNRDGQLAFVIYGWSGSGLQIISQCVTPGPTPPTIGYLLGDVNGDGCAELVQTCNYGGTLGLIVHGWSSSGMHPLWTSNNLGQGAGAVSFLLGDVNGDKRVELLQQWSNNGALGLLVYAWTGSAMQTVFSNTNMGQGSGALAWLAGHFTSPTQASILQPWSNNGHLGLLAYGRPDSGAGSYAGSTAGEFHVDSNGSATYTVPIAVPPGTGGVQPTLAFSYNSASGDGMLGVGFSLQGLSAITRCGATLAQDGFWGSVQYNSNDRFSLDGQRLILASALSYGDPSATYRTAVDNFSKIVPGGFTSLQVGPGSFTVITRDGTRLEYGTTADSQILAMGWADNPFTGLQSAVRVWALSKVTDRHGNYYTIQYTTDPDGGSYYPIQISYTGNSNTGLQPQCAVRFNYDRRPDPAVQYQGGAIINATQRLRSVSTFVGCTRVRTYRLSYQQGLTSGRSQIARIIESDANFASLPPTEFSWQESAAQVAQPTQQLDSPYAAGGVLLPMDITGDGWPDLVYACSDASLRLQLYLYPNAGAGEPGKFGRAGSGAERLSSGVPAPTTLPLGGSAGQAPMRAGPISSGVLLWGGSFYPMDVNGDGCMDLVYVENGNVHLFVAKTLPGGVGILEPHYRVLSLGAGWQVLCMDLDGDGCTDILAYSSTGGSLQLVAYYSTLGGGGDPATAFLRGGSQVVPDVPPGGQLLSIDLDGDHVADLLYCFPTAQLQGSSLQLVSQTQIIALRSNKSGPSGGPPFSLPGWRLSLPPAGILVPGNFAGTGLVDVAYVYPDNNKKNQVLLLQNNGAASCRLRTSANFPQDSGVQTGGPVFAADLNGDGRDELVMTTVFAPTMLGRPLAPPTTTLSYFACTAATPSSPGSLRAVGSRLFSGADAPFFADGAGCGLTGIYQPVNQSNRLGLVAALPAGPAPDLVSGVRTGLGGSYKVTYQPLTNPSVYTPTVPARGIGVTGLYSTLFIRSAFGGSSAARGAAPVPGSLSTVFPRMVADSYTKGDGQGSSYLYGLSYSGGCFDTKGRGWLGFASVRRTDVDAGTVSLTQYNQVYPLIGTASQTSISTAAGKLMYQTTGTYQSLSTVSGAYQILLTAFDEALYTYGALDETHKHCFTYDGFGNRLTTTFSTSGAGAPLYTYQTWQSDTTTWALSCQLSLKQCEDKSGTQVLRHLQWSHDPQTGDLLTEQVFNSTGNAWLTTTYRYDAYGNRTAVTDPSGATTTTQYDDTYHLYPSQTTTAPLTASGAGFTTTFGYDARFGVLTSQIDPNGVQRSQSVDGLGRRSARLGPDPSGKPVTLESHRWGIVSGAPASTYLQVSSLADDWANPSTTWQQSFLDGMGRSWRTALLGPDGVTPVLTDVKLDSRGQVRQRTFPYVPDRGGTPAWITHSYDEQGRLTQVKDAVGCSSFEWPQQGSLVRTDTLSSGTRTTKYTYGTFNGRRLLVSRTDGDGGVTKYGYDALGRPTDVLDPAGVHTKIQVDTLGRTTAISVLSDGGATYQQELFSYDDVHRIRSRKDASGGQVVCTSDALGRPISEVVIAANGQAETTTYSYDQTAYGKGRLSGVVHPDGSGYAYGYDAYGRQQSITVNLRGASYTFSKTFNARGQLDRLVFPDGQKQTFTYSHGFLSSASDAGAAGSFRYTDSGQLAGVSSSPIGQDFTYDAVGRLIQQVVKQGDRVLHSRGYTLSPCDGPSSIQESANTDFGVDPAGRLARATGAISGTYTNKTSLLVDSGGIHYSYAGHQIQSGTQNGAPVFSASYDQNGNMVSATRRGQTTSYTYDPHGRLREAGGVRFTYDHTGRRLSKQAPGGTTLYVAPYFEVDILPSGAVRNTRYLLGGGRVIAAVTSQVRDGSSGVTDNRPQPGTLFFVQDHLGSNILVVDSQGGVVARPQYLPYGGIVATGAQGRAAFRHKFAGQEYDEELGLYYFQARYYDPALGRFLTPDDRPGGSHDQRDAFDRYAYALNNPVLYIDPTGHNAWRRFKRFFAHDIGSGFETMGDGLAYVGCMMASGVNSKACKMAVINGGLILGGGLLLALTPIDGPLGVTVGSTLLGAGLGGLVYEVSALANGRDLSWSGWGIQMGIGAAAGLVGGGCAAVAGALVGGGATAIAITGASRVATIVAGDTIGGGASAVTSQFLNNVADSPHDPGSWGHHLGEAAAVGAAFGAGSGWLRGKSNLSKLAREAMPGQEWTSEDLWKFAFKGMSLSTRFSGAAFNNYLGPSWLDDMGVSLGSPLLPQSD